LYVDEFTERLTQVLALFYCDFASDFWKGVEALGVHPSGREKNNADKIEVLNLAGGTWQEIAVEPGWGDLQDIAWAADGKSFFVTGLASDSQNLIHVALSGKVERLLSNPHRQHYALPRPSPDGKYLAFQAQTTDSNVWLIENF
jgi:dipeptidyl aminopeptidase/acylaminoacyl peptidase